MPMIFWVGLAFVVILFLVNRGNGLRPPSNMDDDVVAIRLLDEAGYDRTKPLEAEFLFFFPKEAAARAACARLEGRGFAGRPARPPLRGHACGGGRVRILPGGGATGRPYESQGGWISGLAHAVAWLADP